MTAKEYIAQQRAKAAKDVVITAGTHQAENEAKELNKKFFQALASGPYSREFNETNELIEKDFKAKSIDIREKAQTVGTSGQGGLLVPTTISQNIIKKLKYISPMRQIATVISNMPANLTLPSDNALPTTYWVGEGVAITESGATFQSKALVPYKLAGLDSFTSEVLADAAINPSMQAVVEDRFSTSLALAENAAFVSGDGSSKPYGFRSSDITPTTVTGNTTAGNLAFTNIVTQIFSLPTAYRSQGVFVTSSAGVALLLNVKDTAGRPIFLPGQDGLTGASAAPASLFGRPLYVVDEIPANLGAGTNETELWYGLFQNYYIGDRGAMRVDYGTNGTDFAQDKITLRMIERVAGRPYLDEAWTKMNIK